MTAPLKTIEGSGDIAATMRNIGQQAKAAALEAVSKKLVNADLNDFDAISAEARALTQACAACHEKYRSKSRKEAK